MFTSMLLLSVTFIIIVTACMSFTPLRRPENLNLEGGVPQCPDGYIKARCLGPNGEGVCIPHPHDPNKPTVYI